MNRFAFSLLSALAITACQTEQASIRPQIASSSVPASQPIIVPANCPPQGLVLRTSHGREFFFLGRDPNDPEVCQWSATNSRSISRFIHTLASTEGEGAEQARVGLRALFPLAEGRSAQYNIQRSDGFWRVTWRVVGQTSVTVPAGTFRTWVVEMIEQGMFGNSFRGERIYYFDVDTGAVVKLDGRVVRGIARWSPPWEAVSLRWAN
jgi:hypothetical protein